MPVQALEGVRVLDFCWVVAGPMTTKYLAEYGATVLRVESRKRPEVLRNGGPFKDGIAGTNRSGYFANNNPNKYGITIDLGHERASELLSKMVAWADLVTENFTPGTIERLGLGFEDLRKIKPEIVLFSASMLGRGGPHSSQPGFGAVLASLSGLTYITGWPDRSPVNPYGAYTDYIAPRFAVAGILAALDYSRRTGTGVHLDMAQLETSLQLSAPLLLDYAMNGREPERRGNKHEYAVPHGIYPCKGEDRWIAIACFDDAQWANLRGVMGDPEWAVGDGYSTLIRRKANEEEVDMAMGAWTQNWDPWELMSRLQEAGVPAGVAQDCRDLRDDPQLKYREHYALLDHEEIGPYFTDCSEFILSLTPGGFQRPAPLMGQHNEYVLKDIMGLSDREYASLEADGVLE